jgi:regulatory protein
MKITRIKPQQRSSSRYSVFLDGAYSFSLDAKTVTALGLSPGMELSEADVKRILHDEQLRKAKEYATLLLSYRARTDHELRERLERREFPPDVITEAMDRLAELKLVDDTRYAHDFARDRVEIGKKGKWRIRGELIKRGVDRKEIDQALEQAPDELKAARELVTRYRPRYARLEPDVGRRRLYALLVRRGFSVDTIREALSLPEAD